MHKVVSTIVIAANTLTTVDSDLGSFLVRKEHHQALFFSAFNR